MNLPVASWRLPDLTYPFPPQIHPHVEAGEAHLLAWVEGEGLVTTQRELGAFTRTRFGELVAREFPAATAEGLLVACEIYAWHFVFDDRFCDEPEEGSDTVDCPCRRYRSCGVRGVRAGPYGRHPSIRRSAA
ncbi:hypothetical protein AB0B67_45780, partial [Streptomyces spectabilis]